MFFLQRILSILQPPPFFRREKGGGCLFTGGHGGAAVSLQAAMAGAPFCAGDGFVPGKVRRRAASCFRKKFRIFPKNRYKTAENAL